MDANTQMDGIQFSGENVQVSVYDQLTSLDQDIMKITGHSTPVMLKKYIKADELEVVDKITDKYNYFD